MSATSGPSQNFGTYSIMSTKEYCIKELKQEHVLICDEKDSDAYVDAMKQYVNYGLWRKGCHRQIVRKPPDRVRRQGHEAEQTDTNLLNAKITTLQEALLLVQEKNRTLEHELSEIRRNIRMLNTGSKTLDKILRMGRTEKTTMGLGYQGSTSSSHTNFVRGNSVQPDKTLVVLEDIKKQNREIATVSRVHIHYCEVRASPHQYYPRWVRGFMFDIPGHSSNMIGKESVNFKQRYSDVFLEQTC
ncbi:hypothetical protein F2Q70_00002144 [Brassica cretica]|uniref:Uncharacterized protein n=1 Tax=Brassica cretica TaxID=69181 RepID=A0A8S9J1X0_BRACR|nr:hypothetical protein F2Q70_00002144 [Brassica cretica]